MFATLHSVRWLALVGLLVGGFVLALRADEPSKNGKAVPVKKAPADAKVEAKSGTAKVEKGPFRVEVTLKGTFEAGKTAEVRLRPESALPLVVATAVEAGTVVKKGDTLVTLETEKADRALRDLEAEKGLADVTLKQAEEEMPLLERGAPLEVEAAAKAKKQADEDLKHFYDIDKAQAQKAANFAVKSMADYLEYAKEELKQLQKMYRNKDLTEETEEIILKRQRNQVEQMQQMLERSSLQRDYVTAFTIPRREELLRDVKAKADLALDRAKTSVPLTLSQKRLALAKAKYERAKAVEHLERVQRDREALVVKSPADGVVYYGRCVRGQWSSAEAARKLVKGGTLMPDEVFMTIVEAGPPFVRATVEEKDVAALKVGSEAKVTPTALPDSKLSGKVMQVIAVPLGAGTFEARLDVDADKEAAIVPGMACTVKLTPYKKDEALTVPAAAVFRDDDEIYVFVVKGEGKPEKRTIKAGKQSGDKVEVLDGLSAGDVVSLTKP